MTDTQRLTEIRDRQCVLTPHLWHDMDYLLEQVSALTVERDNALIHLETDHAALQRVHALIAKFETSEQFCYDKRDGFDNEHKRRRMEQAGNTWGQAAQELAAALASEGEVAS